MTWKPFLSNSLLNISVNCIQITSMDSQKTSRYVPLSFNEVAFSCHSWTCCVHLARDNVRPIWGRCENSKSASAPYQMKYFQPRAPRFKAVHIPSAGETSSGRDLPGFQKGESCSASKGCRLAPRVKCHTWLFVIDHSWAASQSSRPLVLWITIIGCLLGNIPIAIAGIFVQITPERGA